MLGQEFDDEQTFTGNELRKRMVMLRRHRRQLLQTAGVSTGPAPAAAALLRLTSVGGNAFQLSTGNGNNHSAAADAGTANQSALIR